MVLRVSCEHLPYNAGTEEQSAAPEQAEALLLAKFMASSSASLARVLPAGTAWSTVRSRHADLLGRWLGVIGDVGCLTRAPATGGAIVFHGGGPGREGSPSHCCWWPC